MRIGSLLSSFNPPGGAGPQTTWGAGQPAMEGEAPAAATASKEASSENRPARLFHEVKGDGIAIHSCCRYRMYGEFLVDGETGDVWKYDDQLKKLLSVEKEEDETGKLRDIVAGYDLIDRMQAAKPRIAQEVHYSELRKYETVIDATSKVVGKKIEELLKAIK